MPVLTALRPTGIRDYIFASRRLSEIAAGAAVVAWLTSGDADGAAAGAGLGEGELVAQAGGDLLLRFAEPAEARAFAARHSRLLGEEAPGLECAIVHRSFASGGLAEALSAARPALTAAASQVRPSLTPLGLGVTALCRERGLPASEVMPTGPASRGAMTPVSAVVARLRRGSREASDRRWQAYLPDLEAGAAPGGESPSLPFDTGDLVRGRGGNGEIGVIHIERDRLDRRSEDGSGGGDGDGDPDAAAIASARAAASAATETGAAMLRAVLARAADSARAAGGGVVLPVRPLLWDGDRLTVLCDGGLAQALASAALAAAGVLRGRDGRGPGRLRAGVALLPASAPLGAAYDLAVARSRTQAMTRSRGAATRTRGGGRGRATEAMTGGSDAAPEAAAAAAASGRYDEPGDAPSAADDGATVAVSDVAGESEFEGVAAEPSMPTPGGDAEDAADAADEDVKDTVDEAATDAAKEAGA